MIITADLHIKEATAGTVFDEVLPGLYVAVANEQDMTLAILGDVFDVRYTVPVRLLNDFRDWLRMVTGKGIEVHLLPGNHDQYNQAGRHVLEGYADVYGVTVYDVPTVNKWGLWLPYSPDTALLQAALEQHIPKLTNSLRVVFGHFGVHGAIQAPGRVDDAGLQIEPWVTGALFILGHYHLVQERYVGVRYVGSPYQVKVSEAGQEKGYWQWRPEGHPPGLEFFPQEWGKRYHLVELAPGQSVDTSGMSARDEVRITAQRGVNPEAVGEHLKAAGLEHFMVTPAVEDNESRLDVPVNADTLTYAEAYVKQTAGDLPQDKLLDIFRMLWAEVS